MNDFFKFDRSGTKPKKKGGKSKSSGSSGG